MNYKKRAVNTGLVLACLFFVGGILNAGLGDFGGVIVGFFAFGALMCLSAYIDIHITSNVATSDEPPLYRYDIERLGYKAETVIAASANTDTLDSQTVHFTDPDGNAIAIYSHVLKVVGRQEAE